MDTSHIRVEFRSPYNIKILFHILKTHSFTFTSIGTFYLLPIRRIFLDMLGLYKAVRGIIGESCELIKRDMSQYFRCGVAGRLHPRTHFHCSSDGQLCEVAVYRLSRTLNCRALVRYA